MVKEKKMVQYYGFVAVVNGDRNRVKIVVKKVDWWKDYEFVSVVPVWKSTWYSGEMFFDENLNFLEFKLNSEENWDTKKAIFKRK